MKKMDSQELRTLPKTKKSANMYKGKIHSHFSDVYQERLVKEDKAEAE